MTPRASVCGLRSGAGGLHQADMMLLECDPRFRSNTIRIGGKRLQERSDLQAYLFVSHHMGIIPSLGLSALHSHRCLLPGSRSGPVVGIRRNLEPFPRELVVKGEKDLGENPRYDRQGWP